jgi:ATP:ADP antiporter, AAA family
MPESRRTVFTVVPREDKYKAKSFIETFVYRGGDQIGAWFFAGLTALGLTLASISFVAVPLAGLWLMLGWLGRGHVVLAGEHPSSTTITPAPVPAT